MSVTFNKMCNDLDPSCNESAPNKTSYHNLAYTMYMSLSIFVQFVFKIISIFVQFFFPNNKPLFGQEILQMF